MQMREMDGLFNWEFNAHSIKRERKSVRVTENLGNILMSFLWPRYFKLIDGGG